MSKKSITVFIFLAPRLCEVCVCVCEWCACPCSLAGSLQMSCRFTVRVWVCLPSCVYSVMKSCCSGRPCWISPFRSPLVILLLSTSNSCQTAICSERWTWVWCLFLFSSGISCQFIGLGYAYALQRVFLEDLRIWTVEPDEMIDSASISEGAKEHDL